MFNICGMYFCVYVHVYDLISSGCKRKQLQRCLSHSACCPHEGFDLGCVQKVFLKSAWKKLEVQCWTSQFLRSQHVAQCPMMKKGEPGWMHPLHCETASTCTFLYIHCISFLSHAFLLCWSCTLVLVGISVCYFSRAFLRGFNTGAAQCIQACYVLYWVVAWICACNVITFLTSL